MDHEDYPVLSGEKQTKKDLRKNIQRNTQEQSSAILSPRSYAQRLASPLPLPQLSQGNTPPPHSSSYGPHQYPRPNYAYPGPPPPYSYPQSSSLGPDYSHTHDLSHSLRPTGYQMPDFNRSSTIASLPTTPFSSQANTNTSEPPFQTPISSNPTENLSNIHGSRLDLSLPLDDREEYPDLTGQKQSKRELRKQIRLNSSHQPDTQEQSSAILSPRSSSQRLTSPSPLPQLSQRNTPPSHLASSSHTNTSEPSVQTPIPTNTAGHLNLGGEELDWSEPVDINNITQNLNPEHRFPAAERMGCFDFENMDP